MWRRFISIGLSAAFAACGGSGDVSSDDSGPGDGAQPVDATTGDVESGGTESDVQNETSSGESAAPDAKASDAGGGDDAASDASDGGPADANDGETSGSEGASDSATVGTDASDDGPGTVAGDATVLFACGPTLACDAQTQFCMHTAGPSSPDGSTPETYSCRAIPAQCEPGPTCTCLSMTTATNGCPCMVQVGLVATCLFP